MVIIRAEGIGRSFGERVLFKGLDYTLAEGQKIALVARNGIGKSNFLRILAGIDEPDGGKVIFNSNYRIAFLNQEPELDEQLSVWETLFQSHNELLDCIRTYEEVLVQQEHDHSDEQTMRLQNAMEEMDRLQAWDYEARIKQILSKLNIEQTDKLVMNLSGGQRKRVALAKVLIQQPDCILMDEPTNHLDVAMIEWLEGYLSSQSMSLLMVTHDRYFLDKVCNEIIELDNGQLYYYKGNYAYFIEKKSEREFKEAREVDKARNLYRKELEWMRRQPKARGTKSKSRIDAFYDIKEKASKKADDQQVDLRLNMKRLGGKILEFHNVQKSFGEHKMLEPFTYTFKPGERVGIVGKNGVGKSTFLNLIMGELEPDGGKIIHGETVKFGYYSQQGLQLKEDKRIIDVIKDIAEFVEYGKGEKLSATQVLRLFLFDDKQQYTYVSKLSGGEKRRLFLLTVLMQNPNFLILDEPTNDLDIATLNVLEDFLEGFRGCVLIVTHDRYFMDKLVDHLFLFEGEGKVTDFNGNYQDYLDFQEDKKEADRNSNQAAKAALPVLKEEEQVPVNVARKKVTYKEQREYEQLGKEVELLEQEKLQLTERLNAGSSSHEELTEWAQQLEQLNAQLEEKSFRWLELAELMG
jgi:ATP-binding cassette subfamily F protein uup